MVDNIEKINQTIWKGTKQRIDEKISIDIQDFLQVCNNYLSAMNNCIHNLENTKNLKQRLTLIGTMMHDQNATLQQMLLLSQNFQIAWNSFLKREVILTWISNVGEIHLFSEEDTMKTYSKASLSKNDKDRTWRGYISSKTFDPTNLTKEQKILQDQINDSAKNKQQLFIESKRRYNRSLGNTDAEGEPINFPRKRILYWAQNPNGQSGNNKGFSRKIISSAGYIGQGYLDVVLKYPEVEISPIDGPDYIMEYEQYVKELSQSAQEGNAIPGIFKGDVTYLENGNIQFAVKQGNAFRTASISGNVAIALLFDTYKEQLKNKILDDKAQQKIKEKVQSFSFVSSYKLYTQLESFLKKEFDIK